MSYQPWHVIYGPGLTKPEITRFTAVPTSPTAGEAVGNMRDKRRGYRWLALASGSGHTGTVRIEWTYDPAELITWGGFALYGMRLDDPVIQPSYIRLYDASDSTYTDEQIVLAIDGGEKLVTTLNGLMVWGSQNVEATRKSFAVEFGVPAGGSWGSYWHATELIFGAHRKLAPPHRVTARRIFDDAQIAPRGGYRQRMDRTGPVQEWELQWRRVPREVFEELVLVYAESGGRAQPMAWHLHIDDVTTNDAVQDESSWWDTDPGIYGGEATGAGRAMARFMWFDGEGFQHTPHNDGSYSVSMRLIHEESDGVRTYDTTVARELLAPVGASVPGPGG